MFPDRMHSEPLHPVEPENTTAPHMHKGRARTVANTTPSIHAIN
jgi:hypothetical protein